MRSSFGFILSVCCLLGAIGDVHAAITFAPADYDNTANTVGAGPTPVNHQATGDFRDVFWWSINNAAPRVGSGDYINQGNSLVLQGLSAVPGSGPYTALNFTGPSVSGGQTYLAVYDTSPGDGTATKNVFDATLGLAVSADILFVKHNTSGGVVAMYNEGQDGLALVANNGDGNNPDHDTLALVFQSQGNGTTLLNSANLAASTFAPGSWYQITMGVLLSGDTWTMTGAIQGHSTAGNPNSSLAGPIITLSKTGSLSDPDAALLHLTNPGEVGIVAMGNESISLPDNIGISVTNFAVAGGGNVDPHLAPVPEPASLAMWSLLGLAVTCVRRRKAA